MNLPRFALTHRSLVMVAALVVFAAGLLTFQTMPRREDPEIVIRNTVVISNWPGAPADKVDELLADPIERKIQELDAIESIKTQSLTGQVIVNVEVGDSVPSAAIDQVWDELRAKMSQLQGQLPSGATPPFVNTGFGDVDVICLAVHQVPGSGATAVPPDAAYDPREMELFADRLQDELERLPDVGRIAKLGVQKEVIYVESPGPSWSQLAIDASQLENLLAARNIVAPGGRVESERSRFAVTPTGELLAVDQMGDVAVGRWPRTSAPVRLGDLPVTVRRTFEAPPAKEVWISTADADPVPTVLLAISMRAGANVVDLGEAVRTTVAHVEDTFFPPDVRVTRVNDLPRQVDTLVADFLVNLIEAIVLVLAVAWLMMGWRPALVMATAVPLSMVTSFAVVRQFGVELEQFSIASLIIALGMLVDNAIVVSDNCLRLVREGVSRMQAMVRGAQDLAVPVLTSTATTVAAFLPMLTIEGSSGEYMRSLPIVVATTLIASYVVAMLVTPIMCLWILPSDGRSVSGWQMLTGRGRGSDPEPEEADSDDGEATDEDISDEAKPPKESRYARTVRWCLDHQLVVVAGAVVAFLLSLQLLPFIGSQFFPGGRRDQFFVSVRLPEGSPLSATRSVCRQVEDRIRRTGVIEEDGAERNLLASLTTFVGEGGPRLMLTKAPEQDFVNYGFLLVNATDALTTNAWADRLEVALADVPGARVSVERYAFGPPLNNPVEFTLIGPDPDVLRRTTQELLDVFRATERVVEPFSDWYDPRYQVTIDVDADAANLSGVTNADVARTLNGLFSGQRLTTFNEGDHRVDVIFRTTRTPDDPLGALAGVFVDGQSGKVPASAFATARVEATPSQIRREDGEYAVSIACGVPPGTLSNEVTNRLEPKLRAAIAHLGPGYRLEVGGELAETQEGQAKILGAMGIALALIVLVLVAQYNSALKPLVILSTMPLALVGVLLGLWITGHPLGFMAMLGVLSLVGIVINNAIVLIDFIEQSVAEGLPLRDAVVRSGSQRLQPIVLTTLTTIGGLLPLSLFGGPLWEAMANGMMAGLIVSTALTLLVVPTLYVLFAERLGARTASGATELDEGQVRTPPAAPAPRRRVR